MSKEIEKKFLVTKSFEEVVGKEALETMDCSEIEQFYVKVTEEEEIRFRKRETNGTKTFYKTIKRGGGLVREETEVEVTEEEYKINFINIVGNKIGKSRYLIGKLEVDVYNGTNNFFIVEIEFRSEEEANKFVLPKEFCPCVEVTNNKNWKNKNIALKGVPKTE